ncbi:MAG: hypothetical protein ACYTKD_02470 [Planctomycetota bacterium]|jgi:hypothetical protein
MFDPDTLTGEQVERAILADPGLPKSMRDMIGGNFKLYERFNGSTFFGLPHRTEHKVYCGCMMLSHPTDFVFAVSGRTGEALVLTALPRNYSRLLMREGLRPESETGAFLLMQDGLRLTGNYMVRFSIVESTRGIRHARRSPDDTTPAEFLARVEGVVQPMSVKPSTLGGYEGSAYVLVGDELRRRDMELTSDGHFSYRDRFLVDFETGDLGRLITGDPGDADIIGAW